MTSSPSMVVTTGRFTMASIDRMATSGALMIGMDETDPNQPVLLTVKVPPWISSSLSLLLRARAARSWIRWLTPLIESWSALCDDRHQQPVVDGDRDPDVHGLLQDDLVLGELAVHGRVLAQRFGHRLDHRGDVAEADPSRAL